MRYIGGNTCTDSPMMEDTFAQLDQLVSLMSSSVDYIRQEFRGSGQAIPSLDDTTGHPFDTEVMSQKLCELSAVRLLSWRLYVIECELKRSMCWQTGWLAFIFCTWSSLLILRCLHGCALLALLFRILAYYQHRQRPSTRPSHGVACIQASCTDQARWKPAG